MKLYGTKKSGRWQDLLADILRAECGWRCLPEIRRGENGKPFFPHFPGVHFNISHSGEYILCGISSKPIGVDIEYIRPRRETLPRYALTEREFGVYRADGGDWPAFFRLWVRKEAWCKYTGRGLSDILRQDIPHNSCYWGEYSGDGWKACVCGEESAPDEIIWIE